MRRQTNPMQTSPLRKSRSPLGCRRIRQTSPPSPRANNHPDRSVVPWLWNETPNHSDLLTARARHGLLWTKWRKVQHDIKAAAPALARCRAAAARCSEAAARFVAIIAEAVKRRGRARLELVNERINAAIRYASDMKQWHRTDRWSAPLDRRHKGSFDTGMGDCEDYAIAKYVALRNAGTPARDLRLLMVRDTSARTYHAVLAARDAGKWLLLDNRWRRLIDDQRGAIFYAAIRPRCHRRGALCRGSAEPTAATLSGVLPRHRPQPSSPARPPPRTSDDRLSSGGGAARINTEPRRQ